MRNFSGVTGSAVWHARTQAGHLRFVRRGQAHLRRQAREFRLGQAGFLQRRAHLEFPGRLGARTVIAHVAGIFAVGDDGEFFLFAPAASTA